MIEAHFAKSNAAIWLPKPRVKGADAEVGVVAYTLLATQIISVLLSQKCGVLFILNDNIVLFEISDDSSTFLPLSLFNVWRIFL